MYKISNPEDESILVLVSDPVLFLGHLAASIFKTAYPKVFSPTDPATLWQSLLAGEPGYSMETTTFPKGAKLVKTDAGVPAKGSRFTAIVFRIDEIHGHPVVSEFMVCNPGWVNISEATFPQNPKKVLKIMESALAQAEASPSFRYQVRLM